MPKTITSPVKRWPGTVTLYEPLTLPQVEPVEEALVAIRQREDNKFTVAESFILPAILACVEKWELQNIPEAPTAATFPLSPRQSSRKLINWLWDEIFKIYWEEEEVPNE